MKDLQQDINTGIRKRKTKSLLQALRYGGLAIAFWAGLVLFDPPRRTPVTHESNPARANRSD